MPSVSTLKGLGSIDPTDPVYMGMIGMHGTRAANVAVQECDLLLVCGARFDDRVTGKLDSFAPQAKVIHCDIDAAEINKLRVANVALQGDLIQALEALSIPLTIDDWRAHIQSLKPNSISLILTMQATDRLTLGHYSTRFLSVNLKIR